MKKENLDKKMLLIDFGKIMKEDHKKGNQFKADHFQISQCSATNQLDLEYKIS